MMSALRDAAFGFCVLLVLFGALQHFFPARRAQRFFRPEFGIDLLFFLGQYLAFTAITTELLIKLMYCMPSGPLTSIRSAFQSLPLWLFTVIALVMGDFLIYWFHRACHRFEILWRFHAVHHSVEYLDWLAAHREHPFDGIATQAILNFPGILLGLPYEALGAIITFRGLWAIFIHSNVSIPLGPLRILFGAPELHQWHHAKAEKTAHNFANLAPYLDWIFGTYYRPAGLPSYELGLVQPWPRGYFAQLLKPFGIEFKSHHYVPQPSPAPRGHSAQ